MGQSNSGSYAKEKGSGDALGDALIAQGFVANEFALSLNRTIKVPGGFELTAPWSLPSRMFQFPIETHGPEGDRPRTIGLLHPLTCRASIRAARREHAWRRDSPRACA
jgi:hypothetical protein